MPTRVWAEHTIALFIVVLGCVVLAFAILIVA
jgi:hypothetical protein